MTDAAPGKGDKQANRIRVYVGSATPEDTRKVPHKTPELHG